MAQNVSSISQSVFVSIFNKSSELILLNINNVNYQIKAGSDFSVHMVLQSGKLVTINSVNTALFREDTVYGQVYINRSSDCLYLVDITPETRATEGDEGSLDTTVSSSKSKQRTAYITITENSNQVKVMSLEDKTCFNTQMQTLSDVLPLKNE